MKRIFLVMLGMMIFAGCSKDGAGSRLVDGPKSDASDPQPTDRNLPQPAPLP